MKNGSGAVKEHFIAMVTTLACHSVVLGLRVSDGLNGCECKYSVVGQGVAGASVEGRAVVVGKSLADTTRGRTSNGFNGRSNMTLDTEWLIQLYLCPRYTSGG